jgi:hypothetical protein
MEMKTEQEKCIHHWIIDPHDDETSYGRCKLCGMVKEFINDWTMAVAQFGKTPGGYRTMHEN